MGFQWWARSPLRVSEGGFTVTLDSGRSLELSPEPARKRSSTVHQRQHSGGAGDDAGVTGMADGTNGEAEGNTVSRASRQDTAHKNYGGDVFVAAEKVADDTGAPGTPMRRHLFRHAPLILQ